MILRITSPRSGWRVCFTCRNLSTTPRRRATDRRASVKLPDKPARTRFAPSPTGFLHLGSLRTAVFNYLFAKATGGQFILRIEDTDKKRTVKDAEKRIYEDLKWAGLQWDEGPDVGGDFGPYKQSERTPLYTEQVERLQQSGQAYRCFCSAEDLTRRFHGVSIDDERSCAEMSLAESDERASKEEAHVVRLRSPDEPPTFHDIVFGEVKTKRQPGSARFPIRPSHFDDPILLKTDGNPTYHLANVVDDHHMGITHVIRAAEWLTSTPTHAYIYSALGWQPPLYAHVGLLLNKGGNKLSKRVGDKDLEFRSFQQNGIFPEALVNYVALHGWSHKRTDDFLRHQDLIDNFDLKFTKGNTIVVPNKLINLQKRYAKYYAEQGGKEFDGMVSAVQAIAEQRLHERPGTCPYPPDEFRAVITTLLSDADRSYTTPREFLDEYAYFFFSITRPPWSPPSYREEISNSLPYIQQAFTELTPVDWNRHKLGATLREAIEVVVDKGIFSDKDGDALKVAKSQIARFVRWAMAGGRQGPVLGLTMSVLGRRVSLQRLEEAVKAFEESMQQDGQSLVE